MHHNLHHSSFNLLYSKRDAPASVATIRGTDKGFRIEKIGAPKLVKLYRSKK